MTNAAAGWYPDQKSGTSRYWDGSGWTEHTRQDSVPNPADPLSNQVADLLALEKTEPIATLASVTGVVFNGVLFAVAGLVVVGVVWLTGIGVENVLPPPGAAALRFPLAVIGGFGWLIVGGSLSWMIFRLVLLARAD